MKLEDRILRRSLSKSLRAVERQSKAVMKKSSVVNWEYVSAEYAKAKNCCRVQM
jgi:hypothetical protein